MSLKLAIFDLDGTIIDSRDIIQAAMARTFEENGFAPPDFESTRQVVGLGLHEACSQLLPEDIDPVRLDAVVEDYRNAFVRLRAEGAGFEPLYPGARELLHALAGDDWLLAIATGKARRGIHAFYEQHGLADLFLTDWCADDGPGKPHPFMVEEAMRAVGAEPHQSLIVGDAVHDISMGRAAGIHTMGVSWGFGRAEELQAAGAHEIHHEFGTLQSGLEVFSERLSA